MKNNENNINQGDNIIVPNIIGDNEQNYHDTNKNANELLNIKNSINNPELNENNKNAQLIYQKPIIQQNANYIYSKIPLDTKINEKNNNLNNWDKKTEMSNNASENSASPSEIIEYLTKLDNDNNNNENNYLDEVSIIQKKLNNNNNDNSTIKMNIKKKIRKKIKVYSVKIKTN